MIAIPLMGFGVHGPRVKARLVSRYLHALYAEMCDDCPCAARSSWGLKLMHYLIIADEFDKALGTS